MCFEPVRHCTNILDTVVTAPVPVPVQALALLTLLEPSTARDDRRCCAAFLRAISLTVSLSRSAESTK
jgi:hypothetical protein